MRKTFDRHGCMDRTPATTLYKCAPSCDSQDPFLSDLRTACCGSGAVSESELANRTKAKPRGQHRKFSRCCPRLADARIGLAGQAIRCRRSFFFSLCTGSCALSPDRDRLRAPRDRQKQQQLQPSARSCMKRSKISQFEIVKPPALRGLAKRQGWPNTCRFQSGFAIFFGSLPSGALVHLAVFSPSAALAGPSWLINRSLPIFRLRLASSSPTLGAPRHRERARVQADDLLSAMRTPSLHPQLSAAKTSKPPHLELGKND